MKTPTIPTKIVIATLAFLCTGVVAHAQIKLSCGMPDMVRWKGEDKTLIDRGKQACKEAETLSKEAGDLRKEAGRLRKDAESERKQATSLRKEAQGLRKDAERSRKETEKLKNEARDLTRTLNQMRRDPEQRQTGIAFRAGGVGTDTVLTPSVNGTDWMQAQRSLIERRRSFLQSRIDNLNAIAETNETLTRSEIDQAARLEEQAARLERSAGTNTVVASAAENTATQAELSTRISEQTAQLYGMSAVTRYIEANSRAEKTGKSLERAVKYAEAHMELLPPDVAAQVRQQIAMSRGQ